MPSRCLDCTGSSIRFMMAKANFELGIYSIQLVSDTLLPWISIGIEVHVNIYATKVVLLVNPVDLHEFRLNIQLISWT